MGEHTRTNFRNCAQNCDVWIDERCCWDEVAPLQGAGSLWNRLPRVPQKLYPRLYKFVAVGDRKAGAAASRGSYVYALGKASLFANKAASRELTFDYSSSTSARPVTLGRG